MTTGTVFIELVAAGVSILDTLVHNSNEILDTGALYNHQVFDKESITSVPPGMKNSGARIQQVPQLFVVNLEERCLDVPLMI